MMELERLVRCRPCDVVVVGAGFSGLAAARDLRDGWRQRCRPGGIDTGSVAGPTPAATATGGSSSAVSGPVPARTACSHSPNGMRVGTFKTPHRGDDLLVAEVGFCPATRSRSPEAVSDGHRRNSTQWPRRLPPREPWRVAEAARWDVLTWARLA